MALDRELLERSRTLARQISTEVFVVDQWLLDPAPDNIARAYMDIVNVQIQLLELNVAIISLYEQVKP